MPKKVTLKTSQNDVSPQIYIESIESEKTKKQAVELDLLFREATGLEPKMWGGSIVGYGQYTYYRANGDEGEMLATGFAMRKSGPVLYIIPGYKKAAPLLEKLGPHKLGKSCLYLKRLDDVDPSVLKNLIIEGLADLKARYSVKTDN